MEKEKLFRNVLAAAFIVAIVLIIGYQANKGNITGLLAGVDENQSLNETSENLTTAAENLTNETATNATLNITTNETSNETGGPTGGAIAVPSPSPSMPPSSNETTPPAGGKDANKTLAIPITVSELQNADFEEKRSGNSNLPNDWHYKTIDEFRDGDDFEYAYSQLDVKVPPLVLSRWSYFPFVSQAHSGGSALLVNVSELYRHNAKISSRLFGVTPATKYTLSFYARNLRFSGNDYGSMWVVEYNYAGEETSFIGEIVKFNSTSVWAEYTDNVISVNGASEEGGWKKISAVFKTTSAGQYIRISPYYSASDETDNNTYYIIDDFNLAEG